MAKRQKVSPEYKAVKAAFARNLQAAMVKRGWSQSELARQAALHMPDKTFGRDNISKYLLQTKIGILPSPLHLNAIALALRMSPDELMPTDKGRLLSGRMDVPEMSVESVDGGMHIRLNQRFPEDVGKKIMQLVLSSGGTK